MEEKKKNKKVILIILMLVIIIAIIVAILISGKQKKAGVPSIIKKETTENTTADNPTTEESTTEESTTEAPRTEAPTTEEQTAEEPATDEVVEYIIENFDIGGKKVSSVISEKVFAIDVGEGFQFVDAEGNLWINGIYTYFTKDKEDGIIRMYEGDNDYWEMRDFNLSLIYENKDYKDYSYVSYNGDIIHLTKKREDYYSNMGTVYDDMYLTKMGDEFIEYTYFSRDSISDYVRSGGFYNNKLLVIIDEMYLDKGINRVPLYITPAGKLEWYAFEGYISVVPRYIVGDSTTGLVLVNPIPEEKIGNKYTFVRENVQIFDRDTDSIVPDSMIILTPYFEEYYNNLVYDFTNDLILAKLTKKETGEVKYVAFDKYTGKFVYEIKADIYYDYDTDIWLIENADGQWALMHKNGTIITDWYYDCSGFNGNVALVKKTEESPITVIGLELDNGKYNVIDYSSNYYYGDRASYSGVGNYFNITNGDDSQLVCVRRNI